MNKQLAFVFIVSFAAAAYSQDQSQSPFSLELALHKGTNELNVWEPQINLDKKGHFHVVLANTSGREQRVWSESFSEGYFALRFEVTDKSGKVHVLKKKDVSFRRNAASTSILEPGALYVLDVYLGSDQWERAIPIEKGKSADFVIKAIYENKGGQLVSLAEKHKVWLGKVESQPKKCTVYNGLE